MWQQQQQQDQDLFQVDCRLLREFQPLEAVRLVHSPAGKLLPFAASNSTSGSDLCCWQRAASLVQSPASANSESSTGTSTPDQCPASSPAVTLCEMPGSWNGNNNVLMASTSKEMKHASQQQWRNLPPSGSSQVSASPLEPANWSKQLDAAPFLLAEVPQYHSCQAPAAGWNSALNESSAGCSYILEGLNDGNSSALVLKSEFTSGFPASSSTTVDLSSTDSQPARLPSFASSLYAHEGQQKIKQEVEQFPAGSNTLDRILALHKTSPQAESSKIGNFIDLLRQSDRPVSDPTAAASCNHLSQLLSSQEAPGMWTARSSRLPAMLSEVLPASPPGKAVVEMLVDKSKRPFPDSSSQSSATDNQACIQRQDSSSSRPNTKQQQQQQQQQQEGEEPLIDHRAAFGVAANDDITSELFTKRPRIENSGSFPFKMQVRKEKLGERISALQQLVSPFGKTDTASVLLEAIGYIKFLHEQVQVLSSPYMKHTSRHSEHGKFCWSSCDKETEDARLDLRSRGLCLVPISCTLQVANDNGADYWTPTLHGHGGLK